MDDLAKKVEQILRQRFPSLSSLNIRNDDGIIGVLVSRSLRVWKPLTAKTRYGMVWSNR